MQRLTFTTVLLLIVFGMHAQNPQDYYYEIPEYPRHYTAGNVAGRMVDGLGFRFYWATANLRAEDLNYRASEESRSLEETVDHIYNLTLIVKNATEKEATSFPVDKSGLSYEKKREIILEFIKTASINLKVSTDQDFADFNMVFEYANGDSKTWPFWNELNGPMADALWHTGQLVVLRRLSGNPFDSKASVLTGKIRN